MVTNFHQPGSTLLLLVSALIGDEWRDVYNYALANDFRFLSYGDACLFIGS
jgi:S-adenosylmethionine:tRNA ribosyltransferase-isomerase